MFAYKGETLEEYWDYTKRALSHKNGPNLIVDDGGDATLLVHRGSEREAAFEKTGKKPAICTENREVSIVDTVLNKTLDEDPRFWRKMAASIIGCSEETTTGVASPLPDWNGRARCSSAPSM